MMSRFMVDWDAYLACMFGWGLRGSCGVDWVE